MYNRIKELKQRLKYKENELMSAKQTAMRKEHDYNMVKFNPRLAWYGKTEARKAENNAEWIQKEITHLKQEIERAERYMQEGKA
jgi:predicted  nucleic acid-binding Zn-ribbon protein